MLAPVHLEQPVCDCPDLPFTCEYPHLQEIRTLEFASMWFWNHWSLNFQQPVPCETQNLRWSSRPLWIGRRETYVSPNIATRVSWSLHHGLCCICPQSFTQQWRFLSLTLPPCQWLSWTQASYVLSPQSQCQWRCRVNDRWVIIRIYERRSLPKPKKRAADFLCSINAESILQIAMMCDAAAEEMELILESNCLAVIVPSALKFHVWWDLLN